MGMDIEVYEVDSGIDREMTRDGVPVLPIRDQLDVQRYARNLGAIIVTGNKRLAKLAEVYGVEAVYLPPAGTVSKEHYVIEALKRVKELAARSTA